MTESGGNRMSRLVVRAFSISLDGYGAGPDQSLDNPLGVNGMELHNWAFATRTFRAMFGQEGGAEGVDNDFAAKSFENLGAWILGRNMFGPVRGPWPDDSWKGWWGEEPPYHVPVFVLTHHPRPPLAMKGGTTFHFVTGGAEEALARARQAAGGRDIRVGGGVQTVREYLHARQIDELHLAVSPVFLGRGENLFAGIDFRALGYEPVDRVATPSATHFTIVRRG
jgi:dihydrofolate reductase